jgi:hypothetical protein
VDIESKGYKKSKDNGDGIHETHSWIKFTGPYKNGDNKKLR